MPSFKLTDMRNGYHRIARHVIENGESIAGTREVLGANITLLNQADSLPLACGRKLHTAIAAVEALQLIAGESHPQLMLKVSKNFENYMDGGTFHGAYGPRIRAQYYPLISELQRHPDSRRAIMTIWNPAIDQQVGLHDYPCTTSLQFFIRNSMLNMQVYMRSNDVYRGLAYDVFQFTQLQMSIARELRVFVGTYRHYAASLHIYDDDFDSVMEMLNTDCSEPNTRSLAPLEGLNRVEARLLLQGNKTYSDRYAYKWYANILGPYFND